MIRADCSNRLNGRPDTFGALSRSSSSASLSTENYFRRFHYVGVELAKSTMRLHNVADRTGPVTGVMYPNEQVDSLLDRLPFEPLSPSVERPISTVAPLKSVKECN